jgi:hypothetical protein
LLCVHLFSARNGRSLFLSIPSFIFPIVQAFLERNEYCAKRVQGENYDAAETPTAYQRATAICKMHKARVRANNYYWNKLYRKLELEGTREEFEKNKRESNLSNC